ncbi:ligase-associated DNA damage response endonuclease PdeM [Halocola ammonii]
MKAGKATSYEAIELSDQRLILHHWRALYWQEERLLVISDLHVGKSSHFRKNGLPVPREVGRTNFWRLSGLILDFQPKEVLFLGDLSHSHHNNEWNDFVDVRKNFDKVIFSLVPGNHDLLELADYQKANIELLPEVHERGPFYFSHDEIPSEDLPSEVINIFGHIHPGVRMRGGGRQSLRLSCFYQNEKHFVMPAFGDFTGKHLIRPRKGSSVYVVTEESVITAQ